MTRWQLTFRRGERLKYVGHLDLTRAWLRAIRRAGIPLAQSAGFHPHSKLAFASPLPVGILGAAELLEMTVDQDLGAEALSGPIGAQLPDGLELVGVKPLSGPPLAARVCQAVYRSGLSGDCDHEEIAGCVAALLEAKQLPRTRQRERTVQSYDLRPLIDELYVEWPGADRILRMRLKAGNQGTGRPDEVLDALGLREQALWIERTELVLETGFGRQRIENG